MSQFSYMEVTDEPQSYHLYLQPFPSFCMHAHPGNISKHYSTLLQYFIMRHKSDTVFSLARKCSRLSIRFCQQEKRNCYSPEVARETYLQMLQICKGKAPVERKTGDMENLCLVAFFVFFAVLPCWALDPAGPSHKSVSVASGGQVLMVKMEGEMEIVPRVIYIIKFSMSVTQGGG